MAGGKLPTGLSSYDNNALGPIIRSLRCFGEARSQVPIKVYECAKRMGRFLELRFTPVVGTSHIKHKYINKFLLEFLDKTMSNAQPSILSVHFLS